MFCTYKYLGDHSVGVPPLPIPNREVKPTRADGTALSCGRVGRRHCFSASSLGSFLEPRELFLCAHRDERILQVYAISYQTHLMIPFGKPATIVSIIQDYFLAPLGLFQHLF